MNVDDQQPEIGSDFVILKTIRQASGAESFVIGRLNDHHFDAIVFAEHPKYPDFELGDSRITKLWLQRIADKTTVASFNRAWDMHPTTEIARAIVDFLATNLAERIYGQIEEHSRYDGRASPFTESATTASTRLSGIFRSPVTGLVAVALKARATSASDRDCGMSGPSCRPIALLLFIRCYVSAEKYSDKSMQTCRNVA